MEHPPQALLVGVKRLLAAVVQRQQQEPRALEGERGPADTALDVGGVGNRIGHRRDEGKQAKVTSEPWGRASLGAERATRYSTRHRAAV
jgi:hypothetical protein